MKAMEAGADGSVLGVPCNVVGAPGTVETLSVIKYNIIAIYLLLTRSSCVECSNHLASSHTAAIICCNHTIEILCHHLKVGETNT